MLPTSDRCRESFSPQFLAFCKAGRRSLPWPTLEIRNILHFSNLAEAPIQCIYVILRNVSTISKQGTDPLLTVGSPLRSSPTTRPSVDSMKSSASLTVSIATSAPFLRSTATRNLNGGKYIMLLKVSMFSL